MYCCSYFCTTHSFVYNNLVHTKFSMAHVVFRLEGCPPCDGPRTEYRMAHIKHRRMCLVFQPPFTSTRQTWNSSILHPHLQDFQNMQTKIALYLRFDSSYEISFLLEMFAHESCLFKTCAICILEHIVNSLWGKGIGFHWMFQLYMFALRHTGLKCMQLWLMAKILKLGFKSL